MNIKVKGLQEVLKKVRDFGTEAERMISNTTWGVAQEISGDAKQNVNAQLTNGTEGVRIEQSINVQPPGLGHLEYTINVNALPIGAYVEFGTGAFVKVAPEWRNMAWQFKGKKDGYMRPKPYLYPAFEAGSARYLDLLKKDLKTLEAKYGKK